MRSDLERIHDTLRDRICLLVYRPGDVLHEGALAEEFGLSRTPIREVLQRLGFAGLLEARNGVGTIVTERSPEEISQIYLMRQKLAAMIGELSPNPCAPEDCRVIETLLERARALTDGFKPEEYWRINHEAHFVIGRLIGNAPLGEMWDRYYFQTASFWYQVIEKEPRDVSQSLVRELDDVLNAMRRNDAAAVGYIERNYISYGHDRVRALHCLHDRRDGL